MADIPPTGNKFDFFLADGSPDFGLMPGGLVDGVPTGVPIRLQRGDAGFGAHHIAKKHGNWLDLHGKSVAEMVWLKLRNPGTIYPTEEEGKLKISIVFSPTALLILRYIDKATPFFTVVSLYHHEGPLDGTIMARFPASPATQQTPVFTLPSPPVAPQVIIKRRRQICADDGIGTAFQPSGSVKNSDDL